MPRRNRVVRNHIESAFGIGAVDELERWNDRKLDSLGDFGVDLSAQEVAAQNFVMRALVNESLPPESGTVLEQGQHRRPLLLDHPKWKDA